MRPGKTYLDQRTRAAIISDKINTDTLSYFAYKAARRISFISLVDRATQLPLRK